MSESQLTYTPDIKMLRQPKYVCPKCGANDTIGNIQVSIEPFEGVYCQRCYAEWIHANIPKMDRLA